MDIIADILKISIQAKPDAHFLQSLYLQYCERGGLSKKQLEGLHSKASRIPEISPGKLATLEAIIKRKATRYKSEIEITATPEINTTAHVDILNAILEKYPAHKRLVFLKGKLDNRQHLTADEINEIEKFRKLLLK